MHHQPYFWKRMPFARLIVPFIAGIIIQWSNDLSLLTLAIAVALSVLIMLLFSLFPLASKYTYRWLQGIVVNLLLIALGSFVVFSKDISKEPGWIGNYSTDSTVILATIKAPLTEKAKSYKAEVLIEGLRTNNEWRKVTGNVIIYFSKDSSALSLQPGSIILFHTPLQAIKNSGNPGSFNYKQYSAFQGIYHQVFLKKNDYLITKTNKKSIFDNWLFATRDVVIRQLRRYIKGEKEAGVAEALLIGYREDLDKDLVQAYSNTGVVHIIAISGLHLGMIYAGLIFLLRPFKKRKWIRWVKPVIILSVLWIFTMLAGGVPSILRSAVMFSFIILGETINKKSSIYNTLAASAFVMLFVNPYYSWDAGFQLSYAAVISIVIFAKPVYNWFDINNKLIDFFWKLISVTIAAQILTLPIIFYSFHQFPNFFLITNCVIVPLSSVILFAELALLTASFLPFIANFVGLATSNMLAFMNGFIESVNKFPFAVYDGIQNSLTETFLLYVFIVGLCVWLLNKQKNALFAGLAAMVIFILVDSVENFQLRHQQKLVVYNIPQHNAIDCVSGKQYAFIGDTILTKNVYLQNYNLKPSRTLYQLSLANNLPDLYVSYPFMQFHGKRILTIDRNFTFENASRIPVDLIIVSHNPKLQISRLTNVFDCNQFVFDGSNSSWKINQWKRDCDSLHLRYYSTPDEGAFELNL